MNEIKDNNYDSLVQEFKDTLRDDKIIEDLDKTLKGNKSAAVRVRLFSIKLGKLCKRYRELSLAEGLRL